ncbi:MAG: DUF262 domain-containing protein [Alphaproteobacteria bacterium]|nr:DUF262 domain-containing protein [Alphaproteobacteria bacterium]
MALQKLKRVKTILPPENDVLPLDQQEDISDLDVPERWYFGAVLWSTDWTTQTVISQLDKGNINLNPRFQRRNAWSEKRKSLFIESLILGLPVPQIILAEDRNKKGSFIIIDGKQRLLSLRQFASSPADQDFTLLTLNGLKDRADLNGKTFDALKRNEAFEEDVNSFENQTIRTVVIRNWKDDRYLYSVFLRINTGSVQLSPQELRQALHPGPFSDYLDDFSSDSSELKRVLQLTEPDFRMRDVELVLRFFAYKYFARLYRGNLKQFLDDTVQKLNDQWKRKNGDIQQEASNLESALQTTREIFGKTGELRKWNGKVYEKRINRAVFDIMTYYFSDSDIAEQALNHSKEVERGFRELCENENDFLASLETTTKSLDANSKRFGIWADKLNEILGTELESPL